MEKFEQALLDKEDMELSYRGQGIAYMGLTDYEQAAVCFEEALAGERRAGAECGF